MRNYRQAPRHLDPGLDRSTGTHSGRYDQITIKDPDALSLRKRLQVPEVLGSSRRAKLVKLADKTCNLREILALPRAKWSLERRQKYFD